jgi:DNA-binding transcriptional regulator PaaX
MRIILRKRDSVVSIVLFLFNIFGEHTGQSAIKLEHLIKSMGYFDKNETATRMGLSRMVKSGILFNAKDGNDVYYRLTDDGMQNLKSWNLGVTRFWDRYALRGKPWDGKWHMLTFLRNKDSNDEIISITDELLELGLRQINRDLWISPYYFYEKIMNLLDTRLKYLEIIGEVISNNKNLEIIEDIFLINKVQTQYKNFLIITAEIRKKLDKISELGEHLPLLFHLGWNFYDIAVNDPALPKDLLSEWIGDQAVWEMQELRNLLYKKTTKYFDSLFDN